jgi:tetratricopeptide (TPR) repeat protein
MACTESGEQMGSFVNFVKALQCEPYPEGMDPEEFVHLQAAKLKMIVNVDLFVGELERQAEAAPRAAHIQFLVAYCEWGRSEFFDMESTGWLDRALARLDRAVALDPHFAVGYAYRGHLRRLKGAVGPARDDFDRAVALSRGRMAVAHLFRAGLEASLGEPDVAQRELEKALDEGFADKLRILRDPALAKLLQDRPNIANRVKALPEEPVAAGFRDGF